ncbi:MAG: cyanophycin synthetase [Burkholderiales bacterium]|nr:cyanophycin synthetase [Burkholderiales bacterium]
MPDLLTIDNLRHRRGCCFGVPQSTLVARCTVAPCDEDAIGRIEEGLVELLEEPLPPRPEGEAADLRAASLCAFAAGAVQRENRLPVATAYSVQALQGQAGPMVRLAVPSAEEVACAQALQWAQAAVNALAAGLPPPGDDMRAKLKPHAPPGLNTFHIVSAALAVGLPVQRIGTTLTLLGTGCHTRAMDSTLTDATPALGTKLAKSKADTARMLRQAGLPGGNNRLVATEELALQAAAGIGYPVVVKPDDQEQGRGVSADLRDAAAVSRAYAAARQVSDRVLVEKWAPGFTHRLTVFNGKVVRITRRIAGGVTGDGTRTVGQLVAAAQQLEQHRRTLRRLGRVLLVVDEEALGLLAQDGRDATYVPAAGEYVRLRRRDNINAGGENQLVPLDGVHPDNLQLAVDAASLLYLDFAGIDLITTDIAQSWLGTAALICEVNAQPQLGTRSEAGLYERLLQELVGKTPRVPANLLIAADDTALAAAFARLQAQPPAGAYSAAHGLWVGGRRATEPFKNGFLAARALLRRRDVTSATCLMAAEEVERLGLPLDKWDRIVIEGVSNPRTVRVAAMVRDHAARIGTRGGAATTVEQEPA